MTSIFRPLAPRPVRVYAAKNIFPSEMNDRKETHDEYEPG